MIRPIATTNKMEHLCKLLRKADLRLQEIKGAEELSEVVHSVELALTRRSIDYFTDEPDPAASVTAILLEALNSSRSRDHQNQRTRDTKTPKTARIRPELANLRSNRSGMGGQVVHRSSGGLE